jgi:hypothetical protein
MPQEPIRWKAFEYEYREKSPDWFWAFGIIAITAAIASIILSNFLLAVLIVIGTLVLAIHSVRHPDLVSFEINVRGIKIDKNLYPYTSLESFWIEEKTDSYKLIIKSEKTLLPYLVLPLTEELESDALRSFLQEHLHEEELEEPFTHKLLDTLGF